MEDKFKLTSLSEADDSELNGGISGKEGWRTFSDDDVLARQLADSSGSDLGSRLPTAGGGVISGEESDNRCVSKRSRKLSLTSEQSARSLIAGRALGDAGLGEWMIRPKCSPTLW